MKLFRLSFKILAAALLVTWCVLYGYGFWQVTNWFDLLGAFLVELLPAALLLIWVSTLLRREQIPWVHTLGEIVLIIAGLSIAAPLLMVMWDAYGYYVDLKHPFAQFEFHVPNPLRFLPLPPGWY
jgi:hypothetical protein